MNQAHPGRLQNAQRRPKGTTASVSASSLGLSGTFQLEAAGAVAAAADRRFSRPSGHPLLQICVCCAGSACLGCFSGGISTSGIAADAAAQPVATRYVHKQSAVACDLSAFSDRLLVITARTGIEGIRDGSKMLSGNHSGQPQLRPSQLPQDHANRPCHRTCPQPFPVYRKLFKKFTKSLFLSTSTCFLSA